MSVITITSDLGTSDYYLAALKGAIIKACGNVPLVDVNCNIKPFDIRQAAYNIREAHSYFPDGTIHVVHVSPGFSKAKILLAKYRQQFFIAFDNGLLALLPKEFSEEVYVLKNEFMKRSDFFFAESVSLLVSHIAAGKPLNLIAEAYSDFKRKNLAPPAITNSGLKGAVIAIDHFGNAVTNIDKNTFYEYVEKSNFEIAISQVRIKEISLYYKSVTEGDLVAMFNSAGYLEIAINKGKANTLLGISVDNSVLVSRVTAQPL